MRVVGGFAGLRAVACAYVWKSCLVASNSSLDVAYAGPALLPRHRYYWTVCIRDQNNRMAPCAPAAWFELSWVVAGLLAGMLAVMWTEHSAASCTLSVEAPRLLVLSRETDREHLATDLASADRIARRYMLSVGDPAQQHARFVDCEATLVQQIATRHGLSPDHVRANPTPAP